MILQPMGEDTREPYRQLEELTQVIGALVVKAGGSVALGDVAVERVQRRGYTVSMERDDLYRRVVIRAAEEEV